MMTLSTKHRLATLAHQSKTMRQQHGIILLLALIVLVAMSLAGVALVRSVDTANVAAGNLGFRQSTLNETDVGIETALNFFKTGQPLSDAVKLEGNLPASNYSAQMLPSDARGVPTVLTNKSTFDSSGNFTAAKPIATTGANPSEIRYVIDRLCLNAGAVEPETCRLTSISPADASVDTRNDNSARSSPLYRLTARVDGPKNTIAYSQVIFSN